MFWKRVIKRAVIAGLLLLLLLPARTAVASSDVVTFTDPIFESIIRWVLDKSTGDITAADMAGVTELVEWNADITNLTGIEYCVHLTNLRLSTNHISDLSPLSSLTNLTYIDLGGNQINDISPLSSLTNLNVLCLGGNQISDISPLSSLTNLVVLDLGGNQISDISPLSSLTNLGDLVVGQNQISDLSPLSSLTNLYRLFLQNNRISDLSPLVQNSGLGAEDMVYMTDNSLDLWEGSEDVADIRVLEARGVTVYHDPIAAFADTNLEAAVRQALDKSTGDITAADLAGLTELEVDSKGITNLTGIERCVNLARLSLHGNGISVLSPLSPLTNLTSLNLGQNQINDLAPLSSLVNLTDLYLGGNRITDISPLLENTGLGAGDEIDLRDNPLSVQSITLIAQLRAGGVAVATVTAGALHHIVVSPPSASVEAGGSQTFTAQGQDQYNNPILGLTFTWVLTDAGAGSINPAIGVFIAGHAAGTYSNTIVAASDVVTGTASVTVGPGPLDHIVVSPSHPNVVLAQSQTFTAATYDQYNNLRTGDAITWTCTDANAGAINASTGVFTATGNPANLGEHLNVIQATSGAKTGTASVNITGAIINGTVTLQGGSRPASARAVGLTLKLFTPGASSTDLVAGTGALATFTATAVDGGTNTVTFSVVGVSPGSYDITVKSNRALMNVKKNVTVAAGTNAVTFGTMLEGNSNNDGIINAIDFSVEPVAQRLKPLGLLMTLPES